MFKRLYYILRQRLYVLKNRNRVSQGKVYMFHEVTDKDDLYTISPSSFEKMMEELLKNNKITNLGGLVKEKDRDNVVITFDDVYESVYLNAYPVLKKLDIPYTLFVCNELMNRDAYIKDYQIKEMLKDSRCTLGSHNYHHVLSRLNDEKEVKECMNKSKSELEAMFNTEVKDFAFPYGSMYAVSDKNIKDACAVFENVCMTYPLSYNESDGKVTGRININEKNFSGEME